MGTCNRLRAHPFAWLIAIPLLLLACGELDGVQPADGSVARAASSDTEGPGLDGVSSLAMSGQSRLMVTGPLGGTVADGFEAQGGWLQPRFPEGEVALARVELARSAPGRFRLEEAESGVQIEVEMRRSQPVPAATEQGRVRYRGGHATGADVILQVTVDGLEDVLHFHRAPQVSEVSYDVWLGETVAGLRLVANTLEFLDEAGAPRLRVSSPYLVDSEDRRHGAVLSVTDCRLDTSPAPPWGRSVTSPASRHCVVRVSWEGARVAYPARLDPMWTTTGSLNQARSQHTATRLPTGEALVAGGFSVTDVAEYTASAEVYDPVTGTWAVTGDMNEGRARHTANLLDDGTVLVVAGIAQGSDGLIRTTSAERWDALTGSWSTTGSLEFGRQEHTATKLEDGGILVAGGAPSTGTHITAELFDPSADSWSSAADMNEARTRHRAVRLPDGSVLVAGGRGPPGVRSSAEIYDPASDTWSYTGAMTTPRADHAMVLLADGRALAVGGLDGVSAVSVTPTAEVFDHTSGAWAEAGELAEARYLMTASLLPSGRVVVAGGGVPYREFTFASALADCFDPAFVPSDPSEPQDPANAWPLTGSLNESRWWHTAVVLENGSVLVAGGAPSTSAGIVPRQTAELFDGCVEQGQPVPCGDDEECQGGPCVDGFCCDSECGGGDPNDCQACSTNAGALEDGVCGSVADGVECRAATGSCDVAETCDGTSLECPGDGYEPLGTACGDPADTVCDDPDTCDGQGTCQDNAEPADVPCRPEVSQCDAPELCDGWGFCPVDGFEPEGMPCDDGDPCTVDDACDGEGGCAGVTSGCPTTGWMTGGGRIADSTPIAHGFMLQCDNAQEPNVLQVVWRGGRFHLERLTTALCIDDPAIDPARPQAGFDTMRGTGVGRYNGEDGASVEFVFADAGEGPGADHAELAVWSATGESVLVVSGSVRGNHQAHGGDGRP